MALAALLVVLAACGNAGDTADAVRDSASQAVAETTTTTAAPAETSTTTLPARTTTTSRAGTTTTRRGAPATTAAPGATALAPAVPGTYYYDTSGRSTFAGSVTAFPEVTTLVVDRPSGTRQRLVRNLRDAAGNGLASEFTLDYRPEGVFLVSLRLTAIFSGVSETRDLRPAAPVLLLPTGARPGAHTEADLTGAATAKLVVDVVGEERVTVAGRPVDTLVVRTTVTLAPSSVTARQQLTLNIDRASRLWVRERSVTDASAAGGLFTLHSEYNATLQRVTP
ncbi:MAG TPA: hypothetical protein VHF27_10925 [Acidimicrobiales bacterium]|nr:hypothetical protein [Acidimicrobiales bacterium]